MSSQQLDKSLNSRELNALIAPLRQRDNYTNLLYLAGEYLTIAAVIIPTIAFCHHYREAWGLAWAWNVPVVALAVMLVGAVQHRLAGLVHEGAHYILLKNRFWNEFVSDVFCMFPLFSTTAQYRLIHLGHHEYVNDWDHDPELLNLGKTRAMDEFPMSKLEFIWRFYIRIFWPVSLLRYVWDNIYITTLGNGVHPYAKTLPDKLPGTVGKVRITSLMGVGYLAVMISVLGAMSYLVTSLTPIVMAGTAMWLASLIAIKLLPEEWFFRSDLKPVIPIKVNSALRLASLTLLEVAIAGSKAETGTEWGVYFWLLWVLPLFTSWPYYMLLRDLYQHANADTGKLTNSRVIFINPVLRWAMFIYGQDIHLTHHLYPAVPHYNLQKLHKLLVEHNAEYAENVVECHGMFMNFIEKPTLLDVIDTPTSELPKAADAVHRIDAANPSHSRRTGDQATTSRN